MLRCVARSLAATLFVGLAVLTATPALAKVNIRVDLSSQRMTVTNERGERYNWPISSARAGFVTPRGTFRPQALRRMHFSSRYNNAPMPHSIFFHRGWAIHGTTAVGALGRPASHGCVRLAPGHAAKLFAMVQRDGALITVTGSPPSNMSFAKKRTRTQLARASSPRVNAAVSRAAEPAFTPIPRARAQWAVR